MFLWDHMTVKCIVFFGGTDTMKIDPKRKSEERICYLFKLYWFIAKQERMSGPLLIKVRSNILVVIFMWQTVCTTSHVTSTTIQYETFQDSSRQLNPPNDEKVEDQKTAITMKRSKGCVHS